ncbi:MAG TPA: Swt1 family HEPN domain-containing protein [Solirubrobacterales bacterium]
MSGTPEQALKLFVFSNQLAERELDRVEGSFEVDLARDHRPTVGDEDYYPQIEEAIRVEAASMAPHYEIFYSLERTIRALVVDTLKGADGDDWWKERVPSHIRGDAEKAQKREIDLAVTPRSDHPIDYTNFGELGQIIVQNWEVFDQTFTSKRAVERVMASLNTLRGPIAHCSPLAEDEIVRLRLSVRDWYRLQG